MKRVMSTFHGQMFGSIWLCRDFEQESPGASRFYHSCAGELCHCDEVQQNSWSHTEKYEGLGLVLSSSLYVVLIALKDAVAQVNSVKIIPSLYIHCPKPIYFLSSNTPIHIDQMTQEFQVPWKHKYDIISKHSHPVKGLHVKVIDAIQLKNPSSKPNVVVQYERFLPTGWQQDQFSYNDVVDALYVSLFHTRSCSPFLVLVKNYTHILIWNILSTSKCHMWTHQSHHTAMGSW